MSNPLEHLGDRYEVLEPLREGGMGAIYKVRHKFLDHIRVVKVLHANLNEQGEFQERFAREARLATKVRHPNIAEVYDFSIREGTAFLIMEFIDGVNFGQLLEAGGPPKIETMLEISVQALKALAHLHDRDLVHRDISPDNLMLSQDDLGRPLVKLIDLGIVKPLKEDTTLTKTGLFMGKLSYASPEQFGQTEEGVELDQRSDLYSFGVVLYQMLTGELPFSGAESAVIAGHLFHPPKSFDRSDPDGRVPGGLRATVLKSLEKKPGDRWQTAASFAEALMGRHGTGGQVGASTGAAAGTGRPTQSTVPPSEDRTAVGLPEGSKHSEALLAGAERLAQLEQLDEARAQLELLLSLDPHDKKARQLLRRVCDTQLAPLVGEASQLLIAGSFEKAVERLNRAIEIEPENESVVRLLQEAEEGLEDVRQKEEAARALESLVNDVTVALTEDRLDDAESRLARAEPELGSEATFRRLRLQVEQAKQSQTEQRVASLQRRATEALRAKSFSEAIQLLEEARAVVPDHPGVNGLLEEAQRGLAEVEQEEKARALAHALTDIQAALMAADFDTAGELLSEAKASGVEDASLQAKLAELENQLETGVAHRQAVARFRSEIEGLVSSEDVEAARRALDVARAETDRVTVFADLAQQIDVLAKEQDRAQLSQAAQRISSLVENQEFSDARLELAKALRAFPHSEEIQGLGAEIEQGERAILDAEAEERAERLSAALHEASEALESGDLDKAQALAVATREIDSESKEAKALISDIESRVEALGEIEGARAQAQELVDNKEFAEATKVLRKAFRTYPEDNSLEEMLSSVESALEEQRKATLRASRIAFFMESASKLELEGELEKAIDALEDALEIDAEDPAIAERLSGLRARLTERAELTAKEGRAQELVESAGELVETGDLETARSVAAEAVDLVGEGPAAVLLARIDEQIEAPRAKAASERKQKVATLVARAGELHENGDLEGAEAVLTEALELDPQHVEGKIRRQAVQVAIRRAAAEEERKATEEEERKTDEEEERKRRVNEATRLIHADDLEKAQEEWSAEELAEREDTTKPAIVGPAEAEEKEPAEKATAVADIPLHVEPSIAAAARPAAPGGRKWLLIGGAGVTVAAGLVVLLVFRAGGPPQEERQEAAVSPLDQSVEGSLTNPDTEGAPLADHLQPSTGSEGAEALDSVSETVAALVASGWVDLRSGDRDKALEVAASALEMRPDDTGAGELSSALLSNAQDEAVAARREARGAQAPDLTGQSYEAAQRTFDRGAAQAAAGDEVKAARSLISSTRMFEEATVRARFQASEQAARRAPPQESTKPPTTRKATPIPVQPVETSVAPVTAPPEQQPQERLRKPEQESTTAVVKPSQASRSEPQVPTPPPVLSPEQEGPLVRKLIEAFPKAYESLKVKEVRRLWPSLSGDKLASIQKTFAAARSINMKLEDCRVSFGGVSATVLCIEEQSLRPKKGTRVSAKRPVQIQCEKVDGRWIIKDIR